MERKHAIIIVKNHENKYLQYYDEVWNSYLFPNCKITDSEDKDHIINEIKEKYQLNIKNLELVTDKVHTKFSEKDKINKEYHHYFYNAELASENNEYKYLSYEELLKDKRVEKVNSDIVNFVKEIDDKNCEYKKMAKYYDLFYKNKSYAKEVEFIKEIIKDKKEILDVGCGTGIHMELLEKDGYKVDGLDLNNEMLEIAKSRTTGKLYNENLLKYKINKKYDSIISMFAVFNHLNDYDEFEEGIRNSYDHLKEHGILIIDLHNGRKSGSKENEIENYKRKMSWSFNEKEFKEYTNIEYIIENTTYKDTHIFKIYEIEKIKQILDKNKYKYDLFENYTKSPATDSSKNIEIIIYKEEK